MRLTCIVKPKSVEIQFEADSVADVLKALQEEESAVRDLWDQFGPVDVSMEVPVGAAAEAAPVPAKRGRKPKNAVDNAPPAPAIVTPAPAAPPAPVAAPAPVTAPAPIAPPAPTPPAPPAPPSPTGFDDPPALDRNRKPEFEIGRKMRAHIENAAKDDAAQGQWVAWLVGAKVVIPGATFAEAMACLPLTPDESLAGLAKAIGV